MKEKMNNILNYIFEQPSSNSINLALTFMRIGIGIIMILHGWPKITGGIETWKFLGSAMGNLGIHFLPVMWGFLAACTEFFGGIALTLGLGTRIAAIFLTIMMLVALVMHIKKGDPFTIYSHALALIVIFITFTFIGSGKYSLDNYILNKTKINKN